jgi:hypothetical protein
MTNKFSEKFINYFKLSPLWLVWAGSITLTLLLAFFNYQRIEEVGIEDFTTPYVVGLIVFIWFVVRPKQWWHIVLAALIAIMPASLFGFFAVILGLPTITNEAYYGRGLCSTVWMVGFVGSIVIIIASMGDKKKKKL